MKATLWTFFIKLAMTLLAIGSGVTSYGATTCSFSSSMTQNFAYPLYSGAVTGSYHIQQGSVTVSCTRSADSDPTQLALEINNGLYRANGTNNARFTTGGANFNIKYDFYKDSGCSTVWGKTIGNSLEGVMANTSLNTAVLVTFNYWFCVPTGQVGASSPSGVYSDVATLNLVTISGSGQSRTQIGSSAIAVSIYAPAKCFVSTPAGQIVFNYASFSPGVVFAGTTFEASCTNFLPYTVSVSPATGVVAGLRYALGLTLANAGTATSVGSTSISTVGNSTGKATHYINGSMAAGQAGEAGTVIPQLHTLTITY